MNRVSYRRVANRGADVKEQGFDNLVVESFLSNQ